MFIPQNEQGVVALFAMMAEGAGWEFIEIGAAFPDAVLSKDGQVWRVEFEYLASNFLMHGHDPYGCDLIICWKNEFATAKLPILELSGDWMDEFIEVWSDDQKASASWGRHKSTPSPLHEYIRDWGFLVTDNLKVEAISFFRNNPEATLRDAAVALSVAHEAMLACAGILRNEKRISIENLWVEVTGR